MLSQDSIAAVNHFVRQVPCEAERPTLQGLFSRQPIEKFEAGTAVFWEGDEADHVFEVVEGVLRIYKILGDGRRVITGFMYPGDLIGVSLKDRYLYTAEAVTRIQVRRFARQRFQEEINRSPELRPQLFARLCDEMAAAQDQMVLLARKSAEERVCSFLLLISRRLDRDGQALRVVEVPMTRLDMADYLGLTIETVSRIMTRLTSRGVISPSGRHAIIVRKSDKLTTLAGEVEADHNPSAAYTHQAVWPN
ncbi:CRP/FNR family transcriptional regulator [Kaistia hirudinis]|uniref:CRP/FNR family transcriptional regulator n=1 Tax=Kaistia hirudinis TaxID=1293440 RepID=A0A840AJF2_9HYPH|nr:helix-turn-helix domain-containing protein [Kaistia hirudinis]MBB3929692.1 CRP/FNR family transcriptional regulator [Kaistia hirudinis]MBN9018259.1 helix-turn-helix domain-containing protein [Hyphomicrobiales bacterium]